MFRRYFQTNEEDEQEGSSGEEEAEQTEQTPPPEEVWAQVRNGCLCVACGQKYVYHAWGMRRQSRESRHHHLRRCGHR